MIPRITVAEVKRNMDKGMQPGIYKMIELFPEHYNGCKNRKEKT